MGKHVFESLFHPQHIIVVGASERPHSLGERVLTALLRTPFQGKITPVNLRHKTVGGLKAYPNINRVAETADVALILTPPSGYEALFKACHKKQIRHAVVVQDWENQCAEALLPAQAALQKAAYPGLNITVCTPAAIQAPACGLNSGIYPGHARQGDVSVISWHAATGAAIMSVLTRAKLGLSRHISLQPGLSPTTSAPLLDCLEAAPSTRLIVLEYNPDEPLRDLFSAIRHITRQKSVILYCTHHTTPQEQAILRHLSRYCSFLVTFTPDELLAGIHALACGKAHAEKLHVIANTPCDWLQSQAASLDIAVQMAPRNPRPSENHNGYIGSNPSTLHYRGLAESNLQSSHTEALLAVVVPTADSNEAEITHVLRQLQQQHRKPLFISSPLSDGLLQFRNTRQALRAFSYHHHNHKLKQLRIQTAKPLPGYLKTPDLTEVGMHLDQPELLLKALHLPDPNTATTPFAARLHFYYHTRYGALLFADSPNGNIALLPPFNTLQAERLIQQLDLKRSQKVIYQLLHSLNSIIGQMPQITDIKISLSPGNHSSEITVLQETHTASRIRAPYPAPVRNTFTLKNGQTVPIRPLTPEDAEAEQQFVQNLSEKSRQSRFMAHVKALSQSTLASFCNIDYHREGAFTATDSDGSLLGVSRFSCTHYPAQCEFGISVAENMHGQGLALCLMQEIIALAAQQGYHRMTAEILKTNQPMLKLAEKLGFTVTPSPDDSELYQASLSLLPSANNSKRKSKQ
ncbi:GNAT family N-acetyltransferase [Uruburuella testudinis]|uniref:GNAT family N-acetyltransferase n=1 Tax=Uruburuella testudinis TaxID=1282863 RepID=A0ABY4DW34_9NEIS|nr:bifunctional acetate--CoA ligase family protein/GNAT family N-acetyltransferase [Uruburuella testudinis]UOO82693.1 GNAT family N-acetyltransferase [Uruburuella testudinis]